ncbi:MAG TPA: hypothetical protein VJ571_05160 [Candidatus Nitrosotalea sp.]|nr:hypothetical protein [Candidatus Nitrosotalea sp.]
MSEKITDINSRFYDALKNSQPLAFLASLSIVIAAFTYNVKDLPQVYPNAISGAFSFIFAFVFSMISLILQDKDFPKISFYLRLGTYFFLGVGILYILFIAIAFSGKIPQIPQTFMAWTYGFVGIGATLTVWRIREKMNKESIPSFDKMLLGISCLIAATAWFATFAELTSAIIGIHIDNKNTFTIVLIGLAVLGAFSIGQNTFLMITRRSSKKK